MVLADLHNNVFGQDNEPLVFKIRQLEPDVILMAGDMINGDDPDVSGILELCVKLKDIAPIYYSLGNNEGVLMYSPEGPQVPLDVELLEEGVTALYNNSVDTEICGNKVSIGAVTSEPEDFAETSQEFITGFEQSRNYKILLAHYPTLFYDCLADADIDLSVSGHFHGGQLRLPGGALQRGFEASIRRLTNGFPSICMIAFLRRSDRASRSGKTARRDIRSAVAACS